MIDLFIKDLDEQLQSTHCPKRSAIKVKQRKDENERFTVLRASAAAAKELLES